VLAGTTLLENACLTASEHSSLGGAFCYLHFLPLVLTCETAMPRLERLLDRSKFFFFGTVVR